MVITTSDSLYILKINGMWVAEKVSFN